jgi:hypothetical protein
MRRDPRHPHRRRLWTFSRASHPTLWSRQLGPETARTCRGRAADCALQHPWPPALPPRLPPVSYRQHGHPADRTAMGPFCQAFPAAEARRLPAQPVLHRRGGVQRPDLSRRASARSSIGTCSRPSSENFPSNGYRSGPGPETPLIALCTYPGRPSTSEIVQM